MESGSQECNLRFIREIKKRPCLYDRCTIGYYRKVLQSEAWDEVAKVMEWKADFCRERWRNLRCVYTRHLKKMNKGVAKRPYYLMRAMRFALPYITALDRPLHWKQLKENNDEVEDEIKNDESQLLQESQSPTQIRISGTPSSEAQPAFEAAYLPASQIKTEVRSYSPETIVSSHAPSAKKNVLGNIDDVKVEISEVNPDLELHNDAKKMFVLSLLPDVYAMSDVQMRTFKRGVLDIIGRIFDSGESSHM